MKLARLFLTQRSTGSVCSVENLTGADIVAFLLQESDRLSVGSVKGRVAELRSLLKFLYLQGLTPRPLGTVVPPAAGWRDTGVPKAIPAADVQLLLGSCDRSDQIDHLERDDLGQPAEVTEREPTRSNHHRTTNDRLNRQRNSQVKGHLTRTPIDTGSSAAPTRRHAAHVTLDPTVTPLTERHCG